MNISTRFIINTLNKLGYEEFHEAANGREGVDRLAASPVDMVITDWNMSEMSSIDFIKALRAGVNNYVVEPFTPDTIKKKIQAALKA